ncbi:MAG: hypothetical protein KJ042_05345 [Deltaproteobacteria bacterium]|nr:hypothetical protein [Deltaproteobacteria bacterium]
MSSVKSIAVVVSLVALTACAVPLDQLNGDRPTTDYVLKVSPDDAKVYLDGRFIGRARRFAVTAGGHVLRFEHDDFQNETREVVAGRQPTVIDVRMLPKPRKTDLADD